MSIVLLLAPLCSLVAGIAAALSVRWMAKLCGFSKIGCGVSSCVGILLFVVLFVPMFGWVAAALTTTLIDVDPRVGERRLEPYGLPPNTTSDFCYRFSLAGITVLADFQMPEADYLAWVKSQGWEPKRFDTKEGNSRAELSDGSSVDTEVYPVRQFDTPTPKVIKSGWIAYTEDPQNWDNTKTAIYDLDTGRVYFMHTTY
jgi:hypothetical protein